MLLKSENRLVSYIANFSVANRLSIIGSNMDYIAMKCELDVQSLHNFDFKNTFKTSAKVHDKCSVQAIKDIKANLIDFCDSETEQNFLIQLCTN